MLKLYNTLTKKFEKFKPIKSNQVDLYTCGPTVYDYAHIGNLRAFITADLLVRVLKYNNYEVQWAMNTTDVDDKTISYASQLTGYEQDPQKTLKKFTQEYEKLFWLDLEKLNIPRPNFITRATEYIKSMQELIKKIFQAGFAYEKDGSVYFNVKKYAQEKKYGQLADLDLSQLKTGTRVDLDEYAKEDVQDFALWKKSKSGEPSWILKLDKQNLPGRPGWHIECSAMPAEVLNYPFDIHTGGIDLKFPHHENEIAQSTAGFSKPPVNFWIHNEHVLVDDQKMAKRLNNFYTLKDVIDKGFSPLAFRYFVLGAHYQSKLNFSFKALTGAQNALNNLYERIQEYDITPPALPLAKGGSFSAGVSRETREYEKKFKNAINNNLDTPQALAIMWSLIKSGYPDSAKKTSLLEFDKVLGLGLDKIKKEKFIIPDEVQRLIHEREQARKENDFEKSDSLRNKISNLGFSIEDTPKGTRVKKTK